MKDPEVVKYIDDAVRKSTDSSIQAITNLVDDVKKDIKKIDDKIDSHKEIEAELRKEHREEMKKEVTNAVKEQVQVTVNGKIDTMRKENNETNNRIEKTVLDIKKTVDEMEPIREKYSTNQKVKKWLKSNVAIVVSILGFISLAISVWMQLKGL